MTDLCPYCAAPIPPGAFAAAARAGKQPGSCGAKGHTRQANRRRRALIAAGFSGQRLDALMAEAAKATGEGKRWVAPSMDDVLAEEQFVAEAVAAAMPFPSPEGAVSAESYVARLRSLQSASSVADGQTIATTPNPAPEATLDPVARLLADIDAIGGRDV